MPKSISLDAFRYITSEGWRALIAIEMGLKNHEVVPVELAQKISRCKRTGAGFLRLFKDQLLPNGLVAFESDSRKRVQGYRLTNRGYDYLALHQLFNSGQLSDFKWMIGSGKESDVYLALSGDRCGLHHTQSDNEVPAIEAGIAVVVKFHRLGRISFRKVKEKRDYHQHRNTCSWLYLDRLASEREFTMMKALHQHGLAVPQALAHNRNAVVMSFVTDSVTLSRVLPAVLRCNNGALACRLYKQAVHMLHKIASVGLVHGDLNEFNLMVTGLRELTIDDGSIFDESTVNLVLIDFPQMISRDHPSASLIYQRDSEGIVSFFSRFFDIPLDEYPMELDEVDRVAVVDVEVKAPGYQTNSRSNHRLTGNVLLGCTALDDSSGSSSSHEMDSDDNGSVTSSEHSTSGGEFEQSSDDENHCDNDSQTKEIPVVEVQKDSTRINSIVSRTKANKHCHLAKPIAGIFGPDEIRTQRKRELRHEQQQQFQRQVKRHTRAHMKRQNRSSLKAELSLFG